MQPVKKVKVEYNRIYKALIQSKLQPYTIHKLPVLCMALTPSILLSSLPCNSLLFSVCQLSQS